MWNAFAGWWHLIQAILPTVGMSMVIVTLVTRFIVTANWRIRFGTWSSRTDLVLVAHAVALFGSSVINQSIDVGAQAPGDWDSVLRAASILWPVQVVLLALDLILRSGVRFFTRRAASRRPSLRPQ